MTAVLGVCDALLPSGARCLGALMILGEVGDLVESVCAECGLGAAVPKAKLAAVPDDVSERWWDR